MNICWLRKKKDLLQYPCIPSAIQPVSHSSDIPKPDSPKKLNREELRDLVRDIDLPKQKAELLASRLHQWNLLVPGVKITEYRTFEKNLLRFFENKEHVAACIVVNGLMNFMNINYDPNNWRLFVDSSKLSLKAVLQHKGNLLPSIPLGHSVHMKETLSKCEITSRVTKIRES
ncbi:uncharacterized protein TNCT_250121 [Trichonephila clavata]|uniref:Uncharacterized protein n=1 Tax=Trichonephila clavata TaxID=2740835 RepID=A0A8X6I6N9_TRICU|nr:uncharacterized protein TNCT_250121 [Trichonephila clavata]